MNNNKTGTETEAGRAKIPLQRLVMPLVLKKKWFNMILDGVKTEEYREIKDYWARRFLYIDDFHGMEWQSWEEMWQDMRHPFRRHNGPDDLMSFFGVKFKKFDVIHFRNGYRKNAPEFKIEFKGFEIKKGNPLWGAEPGKYYFVLELGRIDPLSVVSVA